MSLHMQNKILFSNKDKKRPYEKKKKFVANGLALFAK